MKNRMQTIRALSKVAIQGMKENVWTKEYFHRDGCLIFISTLFVYIDL